MIAAGDAWSVSTLISMVTLLSFLLSSLAQLHAQLHSQLDRRRPPDRPRQQHPNTHTVCVCVCVCVCVRYTKFNRQILSGFDLAREHGWMDRSRAGLGRCALVCVVCEFSYQL